MERLDGLDLTRLGRLVAGVGGVTAAVGVGAWFAVRRQLAAERIVLPDTRSRREAGDGPRTRPAGGVDDQHDRDR